MMMASFAAAPREEAAQRPPDVADICSGSSGSRGGREGDLDPRTQSADQRSPTSSVARRREHGSSTVGDLAALSAGAPASGPALGSRGRRSQVGGCPGCHGDGAAPGGAPLSMCDQDARVTCSVGSLPTNAGTRDNLTTEELEDGSNSVLSSADSGSCCDSDDGGLTPSRDPCGPIAEDSAEEGGVRELDVKEPDFDADTCKLSHSDISECDLGAAEDDPCAPLCPRVPPIAWLIATGFDVAEGSSSAFEDSPAAPLCGQRPTKYLNLFGRQMVARHKSSDLTVGALDRHDAAVGRSRHCDRHKSSRQDDLTALQDGDWLESFIARARATELHSLAESIVGYGLGSDVASFLDCLSPRSEALADIDRRDAPVGTDVTGPLVQRREVFLGEGRAGFSVVLEASVPTPGRSLSPPARRLPVPLPMNPPPPPMITPPRRLQEVVAPRAF